MNPFRVLLPTWRFFETFGEVPKLYYRVKTKAEPHWPDWIEYQPSYQRRWWNLFVNPYDNRHLAIVTLVESTVDEINDLNAVKKIRAFKESTSYQLLQNVVQGLLGKQGEDQVYQFKISIEHEGDALISEAHPLL